MSLKSIVDAIGATLAARGVDAPVFFGGEHLRALSAPPRIVFVPKGGEGGPPEKSSRNPRPLRTRNERVEAHCWAADYDAAEQLLNDVVSAAHAVAVGSYEFTHTEWPALNDQMLALGRVVVLTLVFRIPVTDVPRATVTIGAATQTAEIVFPAGVEPA